MPFTCIYLIIIAFVEFNVLTATTKIKNIGRIPRDITFSFKKLRLFSEGNITIKARCIDESISLLEKRRFKTPKIPSALPARFDIPKDSKSSGESLSLKIERTIKRFSEK